MPGIYDRIKDTWTIASATTLGVSSTFTVTGTAASGYETFSNRYIANEGNIPVAIVSQTSNQWMICWCTYNPSGSTPNLLRIDTVIFSTSGDSSVTFSPATMDVFVTASSRAIPGLRENNTFTGTNSFSNISVTGGVISGISDYDSVSAVTSATVNAAINYVRTAGYYAAGDGGGALYKRVVSVPSHNGYVTSNGASVYWELSEIMPNVKMFGAKDDVSFNSTTAIQNAIDYVEARNGGPLRLGTGSYRIESTLNMNATVAVDLLGDGSDGIHDVAGTAVAATNLVWYGSAGGTVLSVQSPAATGHMQTGPNVEDIRINCRGVAGIGLQVKSVRGGTFRRIYVIDSTISAFKLTNYDKNVAGEATDLNSCLFDRLSWRCIDSAAVRGSHGLWLTADSFVGNANVSLNSFEQCSGQNWGGSANAAVNITGITQANPGVVTANAHGLVNGDIVYVTGAGGMTQVNDRRFTVAGAATNTFQLSGVDTTSYTAYTSGGTVSKITQVSGHGLFLECGDNNNFYRCAFYRANSGTGGTFYECVRIEGNQGTDSNNFWNLSAGGANSIQIRGTSSGYNNNNTRNSFWCSDNSNGTQYPIADSGCIFTWQSDLNVFERQLSTNLVVADSTAGARTEALNIGNGSLRIRNNSQNHVILTNGTDSWGMALTPDLRIGRLAGSGVLNLGNGGNAFITGDLGLGTNSLLANTKVTISANNTADAVNINQAGTGNGLTVNTRVGIGTTGTLTDLLRVQGGAAVRYFSVLTSGKAEARYNDNAMHGDIITIANNGVAASGQGAGLRFNLDTTNGAGIESAYIRAVSTDTYALAANRSAGLSFGTINAGTLAEQFRIDGSGNIGIGTAVPGTVSGTTGANVIIFNSISGTPILLSRNRTADASASRWFWDKERNGNIVSNGDTLGTFFFRGYDGTAFQPAASIQAQVDATTGANDMPGRLIFSTTPDGTASLVERMRITSGGLVGINVTPTTSRFHVQCGAVSASTVGIYFEKPRNASFAQRYVWEDCGGLTSDTDGAYWRGFALSGIFGGITDPVGGATLYPRNVFYFEYNSAATPTTRRFVSEVGGDTATSRHDIVFRSGGADRLNINGSGNIGIGASSPSSRLDVQTGATAFGGTSLSSTFRANAGTLGTAITNEVVAGSLGFVTGNSVVLGVRGFRHTDLGTDWQTTSLCLSMDVDNTVRTGASIWLGHNKNVGIGPSNTIPAVRFHVQSDGTDEVARFEVTTAHNPYVSLYRQNVRQGFWYSNATSGFVEFSAESSKGLRLSTIGAQDITFFTSNAEKARVTATGNVGIGISSPSSRLHVEDANTSGIGIFVKNTSTAQNFMGGIGLGNSATANGFNVTIGTAVRDADTTDSYFAINKTNITTNAFVQSLLYYDLTADFWRFSTAGTTRFILDGSGRALLGHDQNVESITGVATAKLQVSGTDATSSAAVYRYSADANGPMMILSKSRGGIGVSAAVSVDDELGAVHFAGAGATGFHRAASIQGIADTGATGAADMPGRLQFLTSGDGSATPTERLRITSTGDVVLMNDAGPRDVSSLGYRGIPSNERSANYTLALTDAGKAVVKMITTAMTVTVPNNVAVPLPIGTTIVIDNSHPAAVAASTVLLTITPDSEVGIIGASSPNKDLATGLTGANRFKSKTMTWPSQTTLRKLRNKGSSVTLTTAPTRTGALTPFEVTITFPAAHSYTVNDFIIIAGATTTGYNGTHRVTSIPSSTQVKYFLTADPGAATGTFGTATPADLWVITGDYANSTTA